MESNTQTPAATKATKTPATPEQIARATAITKHQRAAEAHEAAASAIEANGAAGTAEDATQHRAQASKHRSIAEAISGTITEPKTPQQQADDAEDRASAASRGATIADRALRDAIASAANPNDAPQSGGTGDSPSQPGQPKEEAPKRK